MGLEEFLSLLESSPNSIEFNQTIRVIEATYSYTPTAFKNGDLCNQAGENEGSCKIFAFANLHHLDKDQALACFGRFYREDVLNNLNADNHLNIRNFMKMGWAGIEFETSALKPV